MKLPRIKVKHVRIGEKLNSLLKRFHKILPLFISGLLIVKKLSKKLGQGTLKLVNYIISKFINMFKSIKHKLVFSFATVIILLSLVAFVPSLFYMKPINEFSNMIQSTVNFNEIVDIARDMESQAHLYSRTKSQSIVAKNREKANQLKALITNIQADKSLKTPDDRLKELVDEINYYLAALEQLYTDKTVNPLEHIEKIKNLGENLTKDIKNVMLLEVALNKDTATNAKETVSSTFVFSIGMILLISVLCLSTALIISRNISKPLQKISSLADQVAEGDISVDHLEINTKDELKQLANSFEKMIQNLREIILSVRQTSTSIKDFSQLLSEGTTQSSSAGEEIASSAAQVTDGANLQFQIISKVNKDIESMHSVIESIADEISSASGVAQEALHIADTGTVSIQKGISQIKTINTSISGSVDILENLKNQSVEIIQIIEIIRSIASQTNLLALNAAIEAARAGEAGRGFGVVSQEIKKLADSSVEAAKQIGEIVFNIQNTTSNLSDSMNAGVDEIKSGIDVIEETGLVFEKIKEATQRLNQVVVQNKSGVKDILALTDNIKASGSNIVEVSKTFAINSEGVASAAQQLSGIMQENLATAQSLSEVSKKLNILVEKFNV